MIAPPGEVDPDSVSELHDLDEPKRFRLEALHSEIPLDHKPQCGKLAGSYLELGEKGTITLYESRPNLKHTIADTLFP